MASQKLLRDVKSHIDFLAKHKTISKESSEEIQMILKDLQKDLVQSDKERVAKRIVKLLKAIK